MRKVFTLLMILPFVFVGCSDKDDNPTYEAKDFVGEWYLSNESGYYYYEEGRKETFNDSYTQEDTYLFWNFKSDGTGETGDVWGGLVPEYSEFTWSVLGDKLKITEFGWTVTYRIKNLNSNTFTTQEKGTDEDGPYEYNSTFNKIN